MTKVIKAVIFDIDGVIVDSEPLHMEALAYALKAHGIETQATGQEFIGLSLEDTIKRFAVSPDHIEAIKTQSVDYYVAKIGARHLRPGAKALWQAILAQKIKVGCVSSAELKICRSNVAALGLKELESIPLVGFESVTISKPHPMPYLKMLDILDVSGDEALVIEDSDTGIRSAAAAGIAHIYAWPHGLSGSQTYSQATQVIQELSDIAFVADLLRK